jgi:hypothetical protein
VERKRGGPLHAAAEDYGRAARNGHRRTVPATMRSRSTRTAAGAVLGAGSVKRAETRQLLSLLADQTALSESVALLRETQGRAAQAQVHGPTAARRRPPPPADVSSASSSTSPRAAQVRERPAHPPEEGRLCEYRLPPQTGIKAAWSTSRS